MSKSVMSINDAKNTKIGEKRIRIVARPISKKFTGAPQDLCDEIMDRISVELWQRIA